MLTHATIAEFSIDGCGTVAPRNARALIGDSKQGDLLLIPNEDGLFPGFSQTWKAV
jgi:hypothetical protein